MKAPTHYLFIHSQLHWFLSLALHGGEWSTSHCGCFILRKEMLYSQNRRLRGPQRWAGHFREEKIILPLPRIQQWIIYPSLYTNYAILAPIQIVGKGWISMNLLHGQQHSQTQNSECLNLTHKARSKVWLSWILHLTADSASETPNTIWKIWMNWNNLVSIQSY